MSFKPETGSLVGTWTYRSLLNDPDMATVFNDLEFGRAHIDIAQAPMGVLQGRIYGPGWSLTLNGSVNYGNPYTLRFQGRGVVAGEEWIYDYQGYASAPWPNGIDQRPAITGSVVRTVPHASGGGGTSPAGVVVSFYAVMDDPES